MYLSLRHEVARLIVWLLYRLDLLFHQRYPMKSRWKGNDCIEPLDTVRLCTSTLRIIRLGIVNLT
jgi:hypothetical protein